MASRVVLKARAATVARPLRAMGTTSITESEDGVHEYPFTAEHRQIQRSYLQLVEKEA